MRFLRKVKRLYNKKLKKMIKRSFSYASRHMKEPAILYPIFIIVASAISILATQFSHGSAMRIWLYQMTHDEIVEKGICEPQISEEIDIGDFLTNYRFREFGPTDPSMVDKEAPMVALTFDDGPSENATRRILKVLKDNYSRATFFMVGTRVQKYPEIVAEIAEGGNELGNHTFDHANLTKIDSVARAAQIDQVDVYVYSATERYTTVIRPPYGAYDDSVVQQLKPPIVLWDLDTLDWKNRNAQMIVDKVMNAVKDGDVILMHDIYDSTAEAVEMLVPMLKAQGYQIVTVSEMAEYKGKPLEEHKVCGDLTTGTEQ